MEWWNIGIMESWSKTHNFSVWIKVVGINFYRPRRKGKQHLALRGVGPTGRRPDSEFSKSSVDVFSIHGLFIPWTVLFFNQMEHRWSQYSIIPLFHYSNCERSELSSSPPRWNKCNRDFIGQAELAPVKWSSKLTRQAKIAEKFIIQLSR